MLNFVSFTRPPDEGFDNPEVGLIVHVDHRIPGYTSVITVPTIGPQLASPAAEGQPPQPRSWLLVVCDHQGTFLEFLRKRKPRVMSRCRRINHPDQLMGVSDAEIVFLADFRRLKDADHIESLAHAAEVCGYASVTHDY